MSREEAIRFLNEQREFLLKGCFWEETRMNTNEAFDMAIEALEAQRWIPVSERLPENLEEVNVTWVNHDPEPYYNFVKDKPFTATAVYYKERWYWYSSTCADMLAEYGHNEVDEVDKDIEIVAWQKMPEPYKEDNDE